jgi:hypothetical protein
VLVADYLAVHFVLYGLITIGLLALTGPKRRGGSVRLGALAVAALGTIVWTVGVLGLGLDAWVASFWPHAGRVPLIGALLVGTALYILSDEWLTRGSGAPRGAYAFTKLCMLGSLALAVSLNLEKLFFLIIILPVILLFFLLYGLFSGWVYRATGHPAVAGIANAVAFAWALGVTFPLLGS